MSLTKWHPAEANFSNGNVTEIQFLKKDVISSYRHFCHDHNSIAKYCDKIPNQYREEERKKQIKRKRKENEKETKTN